MIDLFFSLASALLGVAMFVGILLPSAASAATAAPAVTAIYADGDSTVKPEPATDEEPAIQIADIRR